MNDREKLLEKFCKESKNLKEALEKMKQYDRANGLSGKVYIDTNNDGFDKEMAEYEKKRNKLK